MTELLKQPQYIIESIILRRLHEKRIEGYTIEMAKEIADALNAAQAVLDPDKTAKEIVTKWIGDCGGGLILTFVQSELLQERIREYHLPPSSAPLAHCQCPIGMHSVGCHNR